jgi:hypothetical protein
VPVAQLIGARATSTLDGFDLANSAIGLLKATRLFYPHSLPASFAGTVESQLPQGVIPIVSYKTLNTNVVSYVRSVNRPLWLCFHHEPEHAYSSGSVFVQQFESQSNLIRSVHNSFVKVIMIAGSYQYRPGKIGHDGSFIPPAQYVDYYGVDVYQYPQSAWPSDGLANYGQFQRWLRLVKPLGKPLAITEYGIAGVSNAARDARITLDARYLQSAFGGKLALLEYWWNGECQFTDAATIATWRAVVSGMFLSAA